MKKGVRQDVQCQCSSLPANVEQRQLKAATATRQSTAWCSESVKAQSRHLGIPYCVLDVAMAKHRAKPKHAWKEF